MNLTKSVSCRSPYWVLWLCLPSSAQPPWGQLAAVPQSDILWIVSIISEAVLPRPPGILPGQVQCKADVGQGLISISLDTAAQL